MDAYTTVIMKIKKTLNIILNIIVALILALSFLLLIFTIVMKIKGGGDETWLFGVGMFEIVSGSMEPEISVGDVAIGKEVDPSTLKVGDNVVYRGKDMLIIHKIIRIEGDKFVTKGIANTTEDAPITGEQIVAKQLFLIPNLGGILKFFRSQYGFFVLIILPFGTLLTFESVSLAKKLKSIKAQKSVEQHDEVEKLKNEIEELKKKVNEDKTHNNE